MTATPPKQTSNLQPLRPAAGWRGALFIQLGLFLLWVGAFYLAKLLEYEPHASLWFPPTAVTFAAFLVFRLRALPGVLAAALVCVLITLNEAGEPFNLAEWAYNGLMFASVHCASYALAAAAVLHSIHERNNRSMLRPVVAFLIGGLVAALMAALLGSWTTYLGGMITADAISPLILPWMIGDYAGLLALGPLLVVPMRALARRFHLPATDALHVFDGMPHPDRNRGQLVLKVALILLITGLGLASMAASPNNEPLQFIVFAAILLQLWVVHTQGAVESLISIALFSTALALLVAVLGLGEQALNLQFIMITLAAASYFGLAVPMLYADNAHLRRLLIRDSLTEAYSRYFFVELSNEAMRKAATSGRPLSLMMIDLDFLKRINDQFGHAIGDQILRGIVRECHSALRQNDLLGRVGGDEFCALLPDTDVDAAAASATRLVEAMETGSLLLPDGNRPSISVGVATMIGTAETFESLANRADMALYQAKRGGRRGMRSAGDAES